MLEGAREATGAEESTDEEDEKEGGAHTLVEGLSDVGTSQMVPNVGGRIEGWRGRWLEWEMEGLKIRGEVAQNTQWEEQ